MKKTAIQELIENEIYDNARHDDVGTLESYSFLFEKITKQYAELQIRKDRERIAESATIKSYYKPHGAKGGYRKWPDGMEIDVFNTSQKYVIDKESILNQPIILD